MKGRNVEKKIYEFLGVNIFRKYVLGTWEKIANKLKIDIGYRIKDRSINGLENYKKLSKGFAYAHLGLFLFFLSIGGIFFSKGIEWFNIIFNLYCIMVQRYTHIRINEIIERHNELEKKHQERDQKENDKQDAKSNNLGLIQTLTPIQQLDNEKTPQEMPDFLRTTRDELLSTYVDEQLEFMAIMSTPTEKGNTLTRGKRF